MSLRARTAAMAGAALLIGAAGGGAIGLLAQGSAGGPATRSSPATPSPRLGGAATPLPSVAPVVPDTLLAWTPGGLPDGFARSVVKLPGVDRAVAVVSGTAWLTRSSTGSGSVLDRPGHGLAIPIEVAAAAPARFQPFVPPADQALLADVAGGEGLLGRSSASLRRMGAGGQLLFGTQTVTVAGVVEDAEIGASELFLSRSSAARLGLRRERYLLIDPSDGVARARLTARIRALLPAGSPIRFRGPGETPYFRQGDAVLPPVRFKQLFGEFGGAPLPNGFIRIDPAWTAARIVTEDVPILGRVTCNRALIPQLRGALQELVSEGLGSLVRPSDYGGCFAPRFINEDPAAGISHHAWGAAIDLNVSQNPFGRAPHQDPRVVAAFERWGFTWGGDWLVPDGMHFEYLTSPGSP